MNSDTHFGAKTLAAVASVILLLAVAQARAGRPEALHARAQFSQATAVGHNAYLLADGFDLAVPTYAPLVPPAPSSPLIRATDRHAPLRFEDFVCDVRPPPAV